MAATRALGYAERAIAAKATGITAGPRPVRRRRRRGHPPARGLGRRRAEGGTAGRQPVAHPSRRRCAAPACGSRCTTPTSAARCWTRPSRTTEAGWSSLPVAPTSSSTAGIPVRPPPTERRAPTWPIGIRSWWRCRSPTSAQPDRGRHGGQPIRCSMRCLASLSRSGPTTGTPVLPPDGIASATAAVQAAWAALVAYYNRLRCGTGDYIDFARFDAVVMALDPPFGAHGQAAAGIRATGSVARTPEKPGRLPDLCVPGRLRTVLCVVAATVARAAPLAGGAGGIPGPQVRRACCALRRLAADRQAGPASCSPNRP